MWLITSKTSTQGLANHCLIKLNQIYSWCSLTNSLLGKKPVFMCISWISISFSEWLSLCHSIGKTCLISKISLRWEISVCWIVQKCVQECEKSVMILWKGAEDSFATHPRHLILEKFIVNSIINQTMRKVRLIPPTFNHTNHLSIYWISICVCSLVRERCLQIWQLRVNKWVITSVVVYLESAQCFLDVFRTL